jgi:uncharacterized membrane protein
MVLLIVPGMFLTTMWFVAETACVGERLGPIESLKRSQVLTKGYRWHIFAIYAILFAFISILSTIIRFNTSIFLLHSINFSFINTIILGAWIGIYYAFGATLDAAVFHELRTIKEKMPVATAVSVFE